jgi:glycosyltransferase involved in cell wall biosynthesis
LTGCFQVAQHPLHPDVYPVKAIPIVSVGMPVYNAERTLRAAVDSILNQTWRDLELVICDNASTDGTRRICEAYVAQDDRVRYFRNDRNIGASGNYNAAFRHSRGRFFKWASSNDTCHPDFLRRCVDVLLNDELVVLAHPLTRIVDGRGRAEDVRDNLDLRQSDPCARFRVLLERMRLNNMMNGVIRSDALRRTPLIRPFFSSDNSLMAELALHGKIAEVPEFLYYRRVDEETATAHKSAEEVAAHYNPGTRRAPLFSQWRIHGHYFGAAWRAPVSGGTKLRVCEYAVRSLFWKRGALFEDLRHGVRRLLGAGSA